jgi:uncharacterized OsmC-like protein/alpha/beta superfamily hydrolase
MSKASRKTNFAGADGQELAAALDLPAAPRAWALFAHCFTCGKDVLAAARIGRALASRGIAVMRFDFTGLGASEGEFANTSFTSNIEDLLAAADHLRREHEAPALLIGHSLGGAAMLRAAVDIPEARAVATIGAPADPAHVRRLIADEDERIRRDGRATVDIGGRPFEIGAGFLDDLLRHRPSEYIGDLRKALLVFHAPLDEVVGIENAREIFDHARHPKSFISLDRATHLLTDPADAEYVADMLEAWVVRYLEDDVPAEPPPEGVTRVRETGTGPLEQVVSVGRHTLLADEPEPMGGDRGPSPYDLLAAALGTCTSMTLRLYADRQGWPLRRVTVDVVHDRIHAADCPDCETREGRIDRLRRSVVLEGDLSPEQRSRLLEIADKCPVHRTLRGEIRIETNLAE